MNEKVRKNTLKRISETFTDEEFERLKQAKGDKTWHDIMELAASE